MEIADSITAQLYQLLGFPKLASPCNLNLGVILFIRKQVLACTFGMACIYLCETQFEPHLETPGR